MSESAPGIAAVLRLPVFPLFITGVAECFIGTARSACRRLYPVASGQTYSSPDLLSAPRYRYEGFWAHRDGPARLTGSWPGSDRDPPPALPEDGDVKGGVRGHVKSISMPIDCCLEIPCSCFGIIAILYDVSGLPIRPNISITDWGHLASDLSITHADSSETPWGNSLSRPVMEGVGQCSSKREARLCGYFAV